MKRKVKRYNGEDESAVNYKDVDYAYDPISKIVGESEIKRARSSDERQAAANRGEPEKTARYQAEPASNVEKKSASVTKKAAPIISVKEMKAAGYDNLRDYLNAKRGLKRRGAAKDENEDEAVASARSIAQGDKWREEQKAKKNVSSEKIKDVPKATEADLKKRAAQEAEQALITLNPETLMPVGRVARVLQGVSTGAKSMNRRDRVEPYDTKSWRNERDITPEQPKIDVNSPRITVERPKLGMKKGGAVKSSSITKSSASSRGDGIAQRGKTRGKMY